MLALARGEWARLGQATLALAAFFFSAYLLYIQIGVIEAICQWCLATDVLMTAIAALALLRLRIGEAPAPPYATRSARSQAAVERQPSTEAGPANAGALSETTPGWLGTSPASRSI